MKITTKLITAVLLLLTVIAIAGDYEPIIKNIWPDEGKISPKQKKQVEEDYIVKAKRIDPDQEWLHYSSFNTRLNINVLPEFDKFNVNYKYQGSGGLTFREGALKSQVIVLGTIEKMELFDPKKIVFPATYKIKIDQFIGGEKFLAPDAQYVYCTMDEGEAEYNLFLPLKEGSQCLFFLTRSYFYHVTNRFLQGTKSFRADLNNSDLFFTVSYSTILVHTKDSLEVMYENGISGKEYMFKLDEIISTSKKIYDLNDPINFYNRKYK